MSSQCFPGCLTIQIRTALCILIVLLIYAVAQACVVSGKGNSKNVIQQKNYSPYWLISKYAWMAEYNGEMLYCL